MLLKHAFPRKGTAIQRDGPLTLGYWDTKAPGSFLAESDVFFL